MRISLSSSTLADIAQHARDAYPDECCGMVVVRGGREEAVRISNVQDLMHQKDPQQFPRTARIAYTMGPDSAPLLLAAERGELELRAFYHSHPEHDAYFSEEDRRQAMGVWDEPAYPGAGQIVVSVYG
ncbi:MAG TPA: Mov34/MPN/PAD-1 family protein, partial [Terriglobales bacterium]|nr:Mov34/MPN/PAD-1 family protein [Terriglobales bacterium]